MVTVTFSNPAPVARNWSTYQQAIFDFAAARDFAPWGGRRSAVIKAVAGSGKSTTLEELCRRLSGSTILLAFNRAIAKELQGRGLNARTFHSLCWTPVLRSRKQRDVHQTKVLDLVDNYLVDEERRLYGSFVRRMLGYGRNAGIGCLLPNVADEWYKLAAHHECEPDAEEAEMPVAIRHCIEMLEICHHGPTMDFDDLLYNAVRDGVTLPKFTNVLVDEGQDTNPIQRAILRKILVPGGRLFAVGDDAQAIYGFRGADSDALNAITAEFDCVELPLSLTYRCARTIVAEAQAYLPAIEAAPNAPEGRVEHLGTKWKVEDMQPGDLVVCRRTAPIVTLAFRMLRMRKPVTINGSDIGASLVALSKRLKPKSIADLVRKLDRWENREVEKAIAKKDERKEEQVRDKAAALRAVVDECETLADVADTIEHLFANQANAIKLSTIHRAKGLEADRVWWLDPRISGFAKQEWQLQQEYNLCYVAITRAKTALFIVEELKEAA